MTSNTGKSLLAMYHEWQRAKAAFDARSDLETPDAEADWQRMTEIEDAVAAMVPETPEDWAFKVIFAHDDAKHFETRAHQTLIVAAYAAAGVVPLRPNPALAAAWPMG